MAIAVRAFMLVAAVLAAGRAPAAEVARPKMRVLLLAEPPVQPGQAVPVEIRLADDAGAPVDGQVSLDVDAGKASAPERVSAGLYRGTITTPRHIPSTRSLVVLARAGQSALETALTLAPGPASTLHVDGPASCPEDVEACRIDIVAADADGNPAAEIPSGDADLGRVSMAGFAEPGRWVIVYHPPRVDRERTDRVTVELGPLRAAHALKLSPAGTLLGFSPAMGAVRVGGRTGFAAGGQLVAARRLASGWRVGAGLSAWWWSVSREETASGLRVSTDRSQLGGELLLLAERPVLGRLTATVKLGGGAVRVGTTDHVQGQPGVDDSGFAPEVSASAGLGWRLAFGMPFVEARSAWVGDAHLVTAPGDQWPLFLLAGFRLDVR